jgi:hypothetical protein
MSLFRRKKETMTRSSSQSSSQRSISDQSSQRVSLYRYRSVAQSGAANAHKEPNNNRQETTRRPTNRYHEDDRSEQVISVPRSRKSAMLLIPSYIALGLIIISSVYSMFIDTSVARVELRSADLSTKSIDSNPVGVLTQRPIEDYTAFTVQYMESSLLNRTKLTFRPSKLEQALKDEFPEIRQVFVYSPFVNNDVRVVIEPDEAFLMLESRGESFLINRKGKILMNTKDIDRYSDDINQNQNMSFTSLPVVREDIISGVTAGDRVMPANTASFIYDVHRHLLARNKQPQLMTLPAIANELHITLQGIGEGEIIVKFDIQQSAREQVGTYLAVDERLRSQNITVQKYIDVRVPEKAFYQ